ncbi:hypothetical protein ACFOYU_12950 [Microvirga sp. GCM10011540]|uniref:hypothetical protein n=1 Tax=Microvirga sp. GCM10011540 TaxID=3317338 RepID=UPI00360CFD02
MTRSRQKLIWAVAALLVSSPCLSQANPQPSSKSLDTANRAALEAQDKEHSRLQRSNTRALRSICANGCTTREGSWEPLPKDPFAELPAPDDFPLPDYREADEE